MSPFKKATTPPSPTAIPQPAVTPARVFTQQEFAATYQSLCKQMGWQLIARPGIRQLNDLGGYIIVTQLSVEPYKDKDKETI